MLGPHGAAEIVEVRGSRGTEEFEHGRFSQNTWKEVFRMFK